MWYSRMPQDQMSDSRPPRPSTLSGALQQGQGGGGGAGTPLPSNHCLQAHIASHQLFENQCTQSPGHWPSPEQWSAGGAPAAGGEPQGEECAAKVRQAELRQAAASIQRAKEEVGWLDVLVSDAVGVTGGQGCQQLAGDVSGLTL